MVMERAREALALSPFQGLIVITPGPQIGLSLRLLNRRTFGHIIKRFKLLVTGTKSHTSGM